METHERTGTDDQDAGRVAARTQRPPAHTGTEGGWRDLSFPLALLGALAAVALVARSAIPVDETRYLSVAWGMWHSGDFLVPHLNGMAYSDKPPLLFWLIQAGWALFGVSDWWPRLVPALCLAGSLGLTLVLGRTLWPERRELARRGAMVLLGIFLFAILATYLLFDPLLVLCTLIALLGLARAARGGPHEDGRAGWSWALVGLGVGLGILAKGPVILLHVLPVALAGPWWVGTWRREQRTRSGSGGPGPARWYGGVALAVLFGAVIGLAWAIPAALSGGAEYARAIFLGQTAGRLSESFAHRRPVWWYLPLLPVILFPYGFWPPLYRAMARVIRPVFRRADPGDPERSRSFLAEPGVRFALAQVVPALVIFSLISGKQPQYLAPLFPAMALLVARLLDLAPPPRRWELALPLLLPLIVAVALFLLPLAAGREGVPEWARLVSPGTGGLFVLALLLGLATLLRRVRQGAPQGAPHGAWERPLAVLSVALVGVLYLGLAPMFAARYDLEPMARFVRVVEDRGGAVAHVGEYRGELHFLGRLERPFEEIESAEVPAWLAAHPGGAVLAHYDQPDARPAIRSATGELQVGAVDLSGAAFVQPIRSKTLAVWMRAAAYRSP